MSDTTKALHALLIELDELADKAAKHSDKVRRVPVQGSYYFGCAWGLEIARDKLAVILADKNRQQVNAG